MASWSLRRGVIATLAAAGVAISAAPAAAVDGVTQINQAKALAGGVTPGDGAGFPVTISASGSYRLTSDLTVPDENTNAISITADSVTLDLNGFSIAGPGSAGTGIGVVAATSRVSVRNGRVRGMGSNAIDLGALGRVEDVDVISNGGPGITLGDAAIALRNRLWSNTGSGITAGDGARVSDNWIAGTSVSAISVGSGASVSGNYVSGSDHAIVASSDAVITGNRCYSGDTGILVQFGGVVASNLVYAAGTDDAIAVGEGVVVRHNVVNLNSGSSGIAGIEANTGNTIIGNLVNANGSGSHGIEFTGSGNAYVDNVIMNGTGNDVTGPGVEIGNNFCCDGTDPATCAPETNCPWGGP
jgi:hypothetical protein